MARAGAGTRGRAVTSRLALAPRRQGSWKYYPCCREAGFAERAPGDGHMLMTREG